jgi:hypothetical protein
VEGRGVKWSEDGSDWGGWILRASLSLFERVLFAGLGLRSAVSSCLLLSGCCVSKANAKMKTGIRNGIRYGRASRDYFALSRCCYVRTDPDQSLLLPVLVNPRLYPVARLALVGCLALKHISVLPRLSGLWRGSFGDSGMEA